MDRRMRTIGVAFLLITAAAACMPPFVRETKANSIIQINEDGSISPLTANITSLDNVTYTFSGDNHGSLEILRANITVDGNQHKLLGAGMTHGILIMKENVTVQQVSIQGFTSGSGVWMSLRTNVTISECSLTGCMNGVYIFKCSEIAILHCNIRQNSYCGIYAVSSSNCHILGNNATSNLRYALWLDCSTGNTLANNTMSNNTYSFGVTGDKTSDFVNYVDESNTIDGKPICYWIDEHDRTIPLNSGYVCLVNSTQIVGEYLNLTRNKQGMVVVCTSNSTLTNNTATANEHGVLIFGSASITFAENNISGNRGFGVKLLGSSNNTLRNNIAMGNRAEAILADNSPSNSLDANNLTSNGVGGSYHCVSLIYSPNTTFSGNDVKNNTRSGVYVFGGSSSNISWNRVSMNRDDGITILSASGSAVFGNSVTENAKAGIRVHNSASCNILDNQVTQNKQGILVSSSPSINYVAGNSVTSNYDIGILLSDSSMNDLFNNIVANNPCGIHVLRSSSNNIHANTLRNNGDSGITLNVSSTNNIYENNITQNAKGACIAESSSNRIYHNSIADNTQDVDITVSGHFNFWDNGYPSGGNYWSKHPITDVCRGILQNEIGCDGICDCNYTLDADNSDNYPLHKPYAGIHDLGIKDLAYAQEMFPSKTVIPQNPHMDCPKNCTCTWWANVTTSLILVNYGVQPENYIVVFRINGTVHATAQGSLEARSSTPLAFLWNTTDWEMGKYILKISVPGASGENDFSDNDCELVAHILVPGDVDNNYIVNMLDLYNIALHFGAAIGQPNYVKNYDVDSSGIINMLELYIAAVHFGQTYP